LENFSQIKAIAFDKTGTLTKGNPVVTDFYFSEKCNREELINVIVAVEKTSTHPLAKAIVTSFEHEITTKTELHAVQDHTGHGLACQAYNSHWKIGKKEYMTEQSDTSQTLFYEAELLQKQGKTVIYVNQDDETVGYFALLDVPKNDAKEMIAFFKKKNIQTIMITGDNEATGQTIRGRQNICKLFT